MRGRAEVALRQVAIISRGLDGGGNGQLDGIIMLEHYAPSSPMCVSTVVVADEKMAAATGGCQQGGVLRGS
jgi:hypothetical protein